MPIVTVYIVRHGETPENVAGIIQGQLDTVLNDTGRAQSEAAAEALSSIPFDIAVTSILQRASETAEILLRKHHRDVTLYIHPLLKERYMGNREGTRPSKTRNQDKAQKRPVYDGEPGNAFAARCLSWWDQFIIPLSKSTTSPAIARKSEINVLAVTHGAVIGMLLRCLIAARDYGGKELLGLPVYNTSITVVRVDAGGKSGKIICAANITHLIQPGSAENPDLLEGEGEAEKEVGTDVHNETA